MDDNGSLKQLVQSISIGVALVEMSSWHIVLENAKFFQWFPPGNETDEPLEERVPGMNLERAAQRIEDGRTFSFECEAHAGARTTPIRVELRALNEGDASMVLIECRDISKQKQAEYMLDSYSEISEKKTRELEKEKERVERLLLNIMPKSVYEEMKDYGMTTPQKFENVSVLMLDFVGFTDMAISRDPSALIAELNDIFSAFDRIVEHFSCERIKTIGDAYLAVSGLPDPTPEHAQNLAKVALRMKRYLERRNAAHPEKWRFRIGINTGQVIGSIVGVQKYVYDIFGPGVNLASRMESNSEPMHITVSESTYELIKDEFIISNRGEFDIKGFGEMQLYYLEGEFSK